MKLTSFLIFLGLILTGCTGPSVKEPVNKTIEESVIKAERLGIEELLLKASRSSPEVSTRLLLQAAAIAMKDKNFELADRIVRSIESPYLGKENTVNYSLMRTELAIEFRKPLLATQILADRRFQKIALDREGKIKLGLLKAKTYRMGRSYLASALELIYIDKLIPLEERLGNHDEIFSTLLQLPEETLQRQAEMSISGEVRGWLSLAAMTKRFQHDPLRQLNSLVDWQKIWNSHPATLIVPRSLEMLSQIVENRPENIALILPLQGELGKLGRAIRDGYIAAHYALTSTAHVVIYDSTKADVLELIDRAHKDGAEVIIGPLNRDSVARVASRALPVPVLALNRARRGEINPNLYQFGLAPEDESRQVAARIILEGGSKGLVIAPDNEWGKRNHDAFLQQLKTDGGNVIDSAFFKDQRDYSEIVKSLLHVDASEERAATLRRITGERYEFNARRRQDIDFIFLLANSVQARGINPALAFFYAEDIPVYATSHVHISSESRIDAIDMNGIRFCDIPWKLTIDDPIQVMTTKTWNQAAKQLAPFYALGVDAHRLYPRLEQLKKDQNQSIFGSTGTLRLDNKNIILRSLTWAQFKDGEVKPIPITPNQVE